MTTASPTPQTFNSTALTGRLVGSAAAGSMACAGLAVIGGWTDAGRIATASALAMACWVVAGLAGVTLLKAFTGGRTDRLAPAVMGESFGRMLLALAAGLCVYFLAAPDGRTFWFSFLAAGLVSLMAETAWAMKTLNRFHAATAAERGA